MTGCAIASGTAYRRHICFYEISYSILRLNQSVSGLYVLPMQTYRLQGMNMITKKADSVKTE